MYNLFQCQTAHEPLGSASADIIKPGFCFHFFCWVFSRPKRSHFVAVVWFHLRLQVGATIATVFVPLNSPAFSWMKSEFLCWIERGVRARYKDWPIRWLTWSWFTPFWVRTGDTHLCIGARQRKMMLSLLDPWCQRQCPRLKPHTDQQINGSLSKTCISLNSENFL